MRIQCACGRYLAKAHPILGTDVDGGIEDVRGDCSRCGPDVRALESIDAWWLSWDAWNWDNPGK